MWAVFVFASLPEIILQSSSTQNDLVLGFFLFASLYLFIYGVREKEKKSLIFSAMAMGISVGIKGSVFMFLPALGLICTVISIRSEKRQFYKPLLLLVSWTVLFFILLSSYNFILNYLDFHNPLGLESYMNFYIMPAVFIFENFIVWDFQIKRKSGFNLCGYKFFKYKNSRKFCNLRTFRISDFYPVGFEEWTERYFFKNG